MDDQTDLHRLADALIANGQDLERELEWFASQLELRLKAYFGDPSQSPPLPQEDAPPPDLSASQSSWSRFLQRYDISAAERLLIVLALVPHLRPQLLDVLLTRNEVTQRPFTEFGGHNGNANGGAMGGSGFIPSIETAQFLLAGDRLTERLKIASMLEPEARLARLDVLYTSHVAPGEPRSSAALRLSPRFVATITRGQDERPAFNEYFPARRITSGLHWEELVLPETTLGQLDEIRHWLQHGNTLLDDWGMGNRLRPGYTSLFCGPPGTGKTLSAALLGKLCGCDVYKVDLSMVVSKYIGETEKNLARVFDQAEDRRWILFFDEADALFGKRTQVSDSHDRYANQEVSYLLQRIEEFRGVVILATNLKGNIDDAFLRRFQSVVHFPMPRGAERLRLWREAFPARATLDPRLDFARLADRHELSGGTIMNVSRYAALRALSRADTTILASDVDEGIRRELNKEGRAL
ncbi:MAG: ATP-binding protein [Rhodocyclaceae bacterium]